jgi:excisionase family DNA binding protein
MEKRLLNVTELSEYISVPKNSIYTMVCLRKLPGVVRLGRALRFEKAAIDDWVNEKTRASASSTPE